MGVAAIATALLMIVTAFPSLTGRAADHLDGGPLTPPGGNINADIADLYAFEGESSANTVLAVTVRPLAAAGAAFSTDVLYELKVDTDGDAVEDISYEVTFGDEGPVGLQVVTVNKATGADAQDQIANGSTLVATGPTETDIPTVSPVGGEAYAGLRSDPFFFDLDAFRNAVGAGNLGGSGRQFNDADASDFFADLDVLAIVLELPDTEFSGPINVWAETSVAGAQVDRMGKPAINTVVNDSGPLIEADSGNKEAFNQAEPADDLANFAGPASSALKIYSSLDTEGSYTDAQIGDLAPLLLPDVLPFDKAGSLPAPLNGRALADDVIDTELRVITGGDPLDVWPERDADGGVNTDSVGPHDDYQTTFPYLGEPNLAAPAEGFGDDFLADLLGENEVPAVASDSTGTAAFELNNNDTELDYLLIGFDLVAASAAHIHLGPAGVNGPVVAALYSSSGEDVSGIVSQGTLTESDLSGATMAEVASAMRAGNAYVNVHTAANPGGEIRGQVSVLEEAVPPGSRFSDDDDSVHEGNIEDIAAAEITVGCNPPTNDNFCPNDDLTRGQMAAFLNRALNLPATSEDAFTDDESSVFQGDINQLAAADITRGCNPPTNDNFCPDDTITRGQMAAFMTRAFNLPAATTDYFTDDDASIFEDDINALRAAGITQGSNPPANTEFSPDRDMSREEMASFLARAFLWGA